MKKTLLLTALSSLMTFTVNAATSPNLVEKKVDSVTAPRLHMGAIDAKNPSRGFLPDSDEFYHRYPNRHLCWVSFNIPNLADTAEVTETFTSPDKATWQGAQSSADGKKHQVQSKIAVFTDKNGAKSVENCWQFSTNDPLGTYTIQVKVNEIEFPAQKFKLLK